VSHRLALHFILGGSHRSRSERDELFTDSGNDRREAVGCFVDPVWMMC
jgi:hypothetical protein